jgi:hypothetical protein
MKRTGWGVFFLILWLGVVAISQAWDYEGHRMVAAVALESLPDDFPAFVKTPEARERVQFLSGEPDRWRNLRDPALRHINEPDHYIDLEEMEPYELTAQTLPELRNEVVGKIYVARARRPDKFPPPRGQDDAKVRILFGLAPQAINENFLKLKSGFSYLAAYEEFGGTPEEISNAQQNILYVMGVMSHYVGDCAQPLHVTKHHHGWVGENPHGYTTDRRFHSWIDGGFINAANIRFDDFKSRVKPAKLLWPDSVTPDRENAFPVIISFIEGTHKLVEPIYQLEKDGKFDGKNPSPEGRKFIEDQLLRGGQFLGDLYYSAYKAAITDTFLRDRLRERAQKSAAKEAAESSASETESK